MQSGVSCASHPVHVVALSCSIAVNALEFEARCQSVSAVLGPVDARHGTRYGALAIRRLLRLAATQAQGLRTPAARKARTGFVHKRRKRGAHGGINPAARRLLLCICLPLVHSASARITSNERRTT